GKVFRGSSLHPSACPEVWFGAEPSEPADCIQQRNQSLNLFPIPWCPLSGTEEAGTTGIAPIRRGSTPPKWRRAANFAARHGMDAVGASFAQFGREPTVIWEAPVILSCNYEELQALSSGAELLLESSHYASIGPSPAVSEPMGGVAQLRPRLTGPLNI